MKISGKFSGIKIAVIGDVMLDRYWWGDVTRISPEAPVPVVKLNRTSTAAGGAANVAANIAGLGASAILIGITGKDNESEILSCLVSENANIECHLISLPDRETTVKTRIVAHNQHVVRLDQETSRPITASDSESVIASILAAVDDAAAVVISDYAKGLLTDDILDAIFQAAEMNGKMVFVDPKSKDFSKYRRATVITPNIKEAAEAMQLRADSPEMVEKVRLGIQTKLGIKSLLVTEGENGMTLLDGAAAPFHLDALARDVFDVTGAGDTVIAAFSVAAASGMGFRESATIANISAGIAVGHIGTTVVTAAQIDEFLASEPEIALGV